MANKAVNSRSKGDLLLCTWNIRSLVESCGDQRVCRKRPGGPALHRQ